MEKTAMAQLLAYAEYRREKSPDIHKAPWNIIIAEIKEKLELERKQIIDAANVHKNILISNDIEIVIHGTETTFGEQYYNENYVK